MRKLLHHDKIPKWPLTRGKLLEKAFEKNVICVHEIDSNLSDIFTVPSNFNKCLFKTYLPS